VRSSGYNPSQLRSPCSLRLTWLGAFAGASPRALRFFFAWRRDTAESDRHDRDPNADLHLEPCGRCDLLPVVGEAVREPDTDLQPVVYVRNGVRRRELCGDAIDLAAPSVPLSNGSYNWWIQTYSDAGNGMWSSAGSFTLSPPATASPSTPSGAIASTNPNYTWTAVSGATWYYLWVNSGGGTPIIQTWYPASAVCAGTSCSVQPSTSLANGSSYAWYLQTYNASGYGLWSAGSTFNVSGATAPAAASTSAPLTTTGEQNPTYTWDAVTNVKSEAHPSPRYSFRASSSMSAAMTCAVA
jgi:hypothetical protein